MPWWRLPGRITCPSEDCLSWSEKPTRTTAAKALRAPSVPPARAPSAAVAEEYELARQKGTPEAFELFIARHGDDPLAEKARAELKRLSR